MTYNEIVRGIKQCVRQDIETRFRLGRLVNEAIAKGVRWHTLCADTGIGATTLKEHRDVYVLFGSRRIPGTDGMTVLWKHYKSVTSWQGDRPAAVAKLCVGGIGIWDSLYREYHPWIRPKSHRDAAAHAFIRDLANSVELARILANTPGLALTPDEKTRASKLLTELQRVMKVLVG